MMKTNSKIKSTNNIYILICVAFILAQFQKLNNISITPEISFTESIVFYLFLLIILPLVIFILIYLPALTMAKININININIPISTIELTFINIKQKVYNNKIRQSSIQVFRC